LTAPHEPSLHLGARENGTPFLVPVSIFDAHTQVLGSTRAGKSYFLYRLFQELAFKTDSALVYIDPDGDAFHFLKRWCYQEGLDLAGRLVLVDFSDDDYLLGFNPLTPWPTDIAAQASAQAALFLRSLGIDDLTQAPLLHEWTANTCYALLATGLTLAEAPDFLDPHDATLRSAVLDHLPPSPITSAWRWVQSVTAASERRPSAAAQNLLLQVLGPVRRRFQDYVAYRNLRLTLGSPTTISWDAVLRERKIVLVNLQTRPELTHHDRRLFGLQLTSDLIQETFRRALGSGEERVHCYLFVDEFQHFVSRHMEEVLAEGGKFLLHLILATRTLAELEDERTHSKRLRHLTLSGCHTKVLFRTPMTEDAAEMGKAVFGPTLDPYLIKDEIRVQRQLQQVVETTLHTIHSSHAASGMQGSGTSEAISHITGLPLRTDDRIVFSDGHNSMQAAGWAGRRGDRDAERVVAAQEIGRASCRERV